MAQDDTFIKLFRSYLASRTDAPTDFSLCAALCSLAVALGNRVWCDGPAREIYPNLQCVVLAPSGMGKSVPLDMASIILRKAGLADAVLPSSFSQEALLKALAKRPASYFIVQEFASFMSLINRDYNYGLESTLTELYDVPEVFSRELVTAGSYSIRRPCITLLGASSPDWFAQAFKNTALRGGFLARFMFCPSRTPGQPIGDPGPRCDETEAVLSGHLRELMQIGGRADMSAVRGIYGEYAIAQRLRARDSGDFGGMRSRAPLMALKVAILFHVSRSYNLRLTAMDMQQAIKFVDYTFVQAERYLTEEVAHDKRDGDRLRVLEMVRAHGGRAPWSTVLKNGHFDSRDMELAVRTLVESDRVVVEREGRTRMLTIPEPPALRAVS